jgi:hypothetical protein
MDAHRMVRGWKSAVMTMVIKPRVKSRRRRRRRRRCVMIIIFIASS